MTTPLNKKFKIEWIPEIIQLFNNKWQFKDIAKKYDIHVDSLRKNLKNNGYEYLFKKNRFNDKEFIKQIEIKYYEQRKTVESIAEEFNISKTTINRIINNKLHGIRSDCNKRKYYSIEDIINMYNNGMSATEIHNILDISISIICDILKNNNIEIRKGRNIILERTPKELYNKIYLYHQYIELKKSIVMIAKELGCKRRTVSNFLKKHNINLRKNAMQDSYNMKYVIPKRGADSPSFGKIFRPVKGYWIYLNNKKTYMRSTWEILVTKYLIKNNINFKYEELRYNLGYTTYLPDFFIYDNNGNLQYLIEVKGYMRDINAQKIMLFQELYPDIELIIWEEEIMNLIKIDLGLNEKDIKNKFNDNNFIKEVA